MTIDLGPARTRTRVCAEGAAPSCGSTCVNPSDTGADAQAISSSRPSMTTSAVSAPTARLGTLAGAATAIGHNGASSPTTGRTHVRAMTVHHATGNHRFDRAPFGTQARRALRYHSTDTRLAGRRASED